MHLGTKNMLSKYFFRNIFKGREVNQTQTHNPPQKKCVIFCISTQTLDDQIQVDSKPAGQPEHASLNQCQLIASNRPKIAAQ